MSCNGYHLPPEAQTLSFNASQMNLLLGKVLNRVALCLQIIIPGLTVDKLVAACILVNAYTTYPCLILVIQVQLPAAIAAPRPCQCPQ